jgi:hypothetical protein
MKPATIGAIAVAGVASATVMPWTDVFKGILGAGGVPPALFLMVVGGLTIAIVVLARAFQKSEDARDIERANDAKSALAIQEKRIEEGKAMLLALERTATALAAHTAALESRTNTVAEMVQALAKIAQNQDATRTHFEGITTRLEEAQKETLRLLRGR